MNVVGSTSDVEIKKTTNLETNLHGLAKFANYSVRVLAFTSAGEGVRSSPVHCTTEEDGESHTVILSVKSSFISSNLIHNSYINYIKLNASTCFGRHPPILRRSVSLIIHVCSLWYSHSLQVAVLYTC